MNALWTHISSKSYSSLKIWIIFYNICSYKYDLKFNLSHREADKPYLRVVKFLDYYTLFMVQKFKF